MLLLAILGKSRHSDELDITYASILPDRRAISNVPATSFMAGDDVKFQMQR